MAWNLDSGSGGNKNVVLVQDGERSNHSFPSTTTLNDAVKNVATGAGLGSVLVRADGRDVEQDEGDSALSEFGSIEVMPKMAGA